MPPSAQELNPKDLQLIVEGLQPFLSAPLTFRAMFGGIMAYLDGNPFLTLYDQGVGMKVKGALYDELCGIEGAEPVRYEPTDPPSKSYVKVPDKWLKSEFAAADPLVSWAQRAAEQVLTAPKKKKK